MVGTGAGLLCDRPAGGVGGEVWGQLEALGSQRASDQVLQDHREESSSSSLDIC